MSGVVSRRRDVHQDGLGGRCDLDAVVLEALLHATVEFALHRPAAGLGAADLADDRHHGAVDLVDAPELEIAADQAAEFDLAAHLVDDILEDLAGAVGILLVGDVDADGRIAGAAAGIGDGRDRAERHDVHGTVAGPEPDRADRDVLDHARQPRHADAVADLDGVLQQQEQPGDEVLHQLLRAEADGDADDAGARQQRRDVDADLAERREADDGGDHAQQGRAQHRLKGPQPRGAGIVPIARQRIDLAVQQRVAGFPDRRRDEYGKSDRHHRRDQPAADLAAIEPDDGVDAPDFEHGHQADEGDHAGYDLAQQRQVAVGADLEARKALEDLRLDAEAAVDQAQRQHDGNTRDQRHRDGADEILQQQRIAVANVQRPHGPPRQVGRDGKIVPPARDAVAQPRRDPLPVGRRADGFGDLAAALQDDDDDEEMHDQHHHAQERGIAAAMQAEQQRHIGKGDAGDADTDDTARPDLDIGGGFGLDRKQAERSRQHTDHTEEPPRERIGVDDGEDHETDGGGPADLGAEQRRGDADKDQHG